MRYLYSYIYYHILCIALLCCSGGGLKAQEGVIPLFLRSGGDTLYYPFYSGVQLIAIDHVSAWDSRIFYLEQAHPRALSYAMIEPPSLPNVYLFRDTAGRIVKAFNTRLGLDQLTEAFKRIPLGQKSSNPAHSLFPYHSSKTVSEGVWPYSSSRRYFFNGHYKIYDPSALNVESEPVGLMDSLGNITMPLEYQSLVPLEDNVLAGKAGAFGITDRHNRIVLPLEYTEFEWNTVNVIAFQKNSKMVYLYLIKEARLVQMNGYDVVHNLNRLDEMKVTTVVKDGKWGFINPQYEEVVAPVYDVCEFYSRYQGLGRVFKNGYWGYIDESGKEVIPCQYEYASQFDKDGTAQVQYNGKFYCIGLKGEKKNTCNKTPDWYLTSETTGNFQVAKDKSSSLYGIIKVSDGTVAVPVIYEGIHLGKSQKGFWVQKNRKWGWMDEHLDLVLPCLYDEIGSFSLGYAVVRRDTKHGLINEDFKETIPCLYDYLGVYSTENILFLADGKYGIMTAKAKIIIPGIYEELHPFNESGYARVKKDGLYGFIDREGNIVMPFQPHLVGDQVLNGRVLFEHNGKYGFLGLRGNVAIPAVYTQVNAFEQLIAGVKKQEKWGFIDTTGKAVTTFEYDYIDNHWMGFKYQEVRKNGKVGVVNREGKEIIPCIYDDLMGYGGEEYGFTVRLGNQSFRIDASGKKIG